MGDGLTFQLGKIPILLIILSFIFGIFYFARKKKLDIYLKTYLFVLFSFLFSLFMMTQYSSFIWERISYLWYIQFPWRFLTFTDLFIAIIAAFSIFFLKELLEIFNKKNNTLIIGLLVAGAVTITIAKYYIYFKPQKLISTNDQIKTSFKEIAWRVSGTSYEFVPNTVKTKKTDLGTTTIAIDEKDLTNEPAIIKTGLAKIAVLKNNFAIKEFSVNAATPTTFQLNTYNFPGWEASIDGQKTAISSNNDLSLITITVPPGKHDLLFSFKDTPVRTVGNIISLISLVIIGLFFLLRNRLIN